MIEALGPHMPVAASFDQLRRDPNFAPRFAHAALDEVLDAELPSDLLQVLRLSFQGEDGVPAQYLETGNLRQIRDQVLGDAIAEKLLLGIGADICERQDRDRRLFSE
jgi:hypothetical protein